MCHLGSKKESQKDWHWALRSDWASSEAQLFHKSQSWCQRRAGMLRSCEMQVGKGEKVFYGLSG